VAQGLYIPVAQGLYIPVAQSFHIPLTIPSSVFGWLLC